MCSSKLLQILFTIPAFINFGPFWTHFINTSVALSLLEITLFFREQSSYFAISLVTGYLIWFLVLQNLDDELQLPYPFSSPLHRAGHLHHHTDMTVPVKAPLLSLCFSLRPEQLAGQKGSEKHIWFPFPLLLPLFPPAGQHRGNSLLVPADTSKASGSLDLQGKEFLVSQKRTTLIYLMTVGIIIKKNIS